MGYLLPSDYPLYGLPDDTADAWVTMASAMIDGFCRRPSLESASYTERMRVPERSQSVRLSYGPLISVDAVRARYALGWECHEPSLALAAGIFGLPGTWVTVDPGTLEVSAATGEIRFPWSLMGVRYSEAEVTYTAGLTTIPDGVKAACAQVVRNAMGTPGLNVKSAKLDTLQTEYFADSLLDGQVKSMLRPYVAERLG